jgi:hypothetical protein
VLIRRLSAIETLIPALAVDLRRVLSQSEHQEVQNASDPQDDAIVAFQRMGVRIPSSKEHGARKGETPDHAENHNTHLQPEQDRRPQEHGREVCDKISSIRLSPEE